MVAVDVVQVPVVDALRLALQVAVLAARVVLAVPGADFYVQLQGK
jgi:hypothetical protein